MTHPSVPLSYRLSLENHEQLRSWVNRAAGLRLGAESITLFERRLSSRVTALGCDSFADYCRAIGGDKSELSVIVDLLTPKETYFFRQRYQFDHLRDEIIARLRETPAWNGPVVVWSAGCATGEEAYSLAITLAEAGVTHETSVRVLGSDLSPKCVSFAREGVYGARALRTTPPDIQAKYFERTTEGYRVTRAICDLCRFGQLDLLDSERAVLLGQAHVIFCRNVLIYLDSWARQRVIQTLSERLRPGGYLLLGHSESLLDLSPEFTTEEISGDLVHRKCIASESLRP